MRRRLSLIAITFAAWSAGYAQAPAYTGRTPTYDVVSVKPDRSGTMMVRMMVRGNTFQATNVTLSMLLQNAFGMKSDQISGAPGWFDSDHFDFEAKVTDADAPALEKVSPAARREMLLAVLVERFQLKFHHETKLLPVYEVVLAKGGSKMKVATQGDTYANGIKGPDGAAHPGMMRMGAGQLNAQGIAMVQLTDMLSNYAHRIVLDKTGLTGTFDFTLNFTPEQAGPMEPPDAKDAGAADAAPGIFTAIQEQLGLRLQPAKGPVDTLVIDHAEKPVEN